MLAFLLLFVGILSRLVLHTPNFTPVIALALFGGSFLKKKYALLLPLLLMMISDIIIGLHGTILFTWGSVLLIAAIGIRLRARRDIRMFLSSGIVSALLFFIITNFGAWLTMYPHTFEGLKTCYIAAIPFFRMTLISTLVYGGIFYGLYEILASLIKKTRFATYLI